MAEPVPTVGGHHGQPPPSQPHSPSLLRGLEASRSAEPSRSEAAPSLSEGLFSPAGPSSIAAREPAETYREITGGKKTPRGFHSWEA